MDACCEAKAEELSALRDEHKKVLIIVLVINAVLFLLVGSGIIEGFRVSGFFAALVGSIVMGIVNGLISNVVIGKD